MSIMNITTVILAIAKQKNGCFHDELLSHSNTLTTPAELSVSAACLPEETTTAHV